MPGFRVRILGTIIPHWLEGHPIGRALFAVGSAYRVGKDGKRVGIPIGTDLLDPANLNADLLDEDHLSPQPPVGLRNVVRGQPLPKHTDPVGLLVQQSWMLTLLGPALALPPVRDKLLARAGNSKWKGIAYPVGASLRYSSEEDLSRWLAWFRHMITNFKGGMIYCLAPVFSQTSASLRGRLIEEISSYLDATPTDATREQDSKESLQDYIAFALSYLLQGDITDGLRQKARSVLDKVPHPCAGLCLLNLGHPGDIQETLADWRKDRRVSDSHQGYITALRFWAGEVSFEEALPDITKNLGTLVFDSPAFVRALTEEQHRAILSELLLRGMKDEAFVRLYEEKIGIIANSGSITNRNWLRTELLEHLCLQHSERIDDSLWRTLLQLGEDTIGAAELQEHIRRVALAGDRGWNNPYWGQSQKLISMSGTVATHENSIRAALEATLRGEFLPEFYQDFQMREIHQQDASLEQSYRINADSVAQRFMMKPIALAFRKRREEIANRPATSLKLPGCREVQYAAAVALSRGGVDFFTEDIRRFIHQSCRSRIGNSVTREDWGVKINRGYKENQHPWLGWIQAGMRIVPDLNGRTEVLLTIELAARAFQQNAPNGDARETVAPA